MSIGAPKGRKPLAAEALLRLGRNGVAGLPDHRAEETGIACADALMAALALFSLPSPALLAFDQARVEGHVPTIDGIARAPCDPHLRARLAPVSPASVRPVGPGVLRQRQRGTGREPRIGLHGSSGRALDGTGYCSSKTGHGQAWLPKVPRPGSRPYSPQRWGAAMIHPDFRAVMPRMPAPMIKHDGTEHHDGERKAAQRLLATLRQDHPPLPCIVTADGLRANAPPSSPCMRTVAPLCSAGKQARRPRCSSRGRPPRQASM